ncbi:hypothetical protein A3F06_01100 [candidate division TM6 bacterium RIFCSPHIGHO2_12_FULL_36_22]|nr:MAG: hypothetical protein A3F06_01100 [candidate division TM6 bacterium RIFCSPHIGHO2_12_FULL_36_22]
MGKIQRLSSDEIKKIAAGEVVERPANIVKELVENSLDAGATKVDIYVEDAGKKLIRIVDNGSGMSVEDAHACFEQHATSKLRSVDQLHTIDTYGFRGEALSSIAAVSKVSLTTKEEGAKQGVNLMLEYGKVVNEQAAAAAQGTDLTIAEIFSNVPARRKFLKTNATEWNQIIQLFQALCLTYPAVHFTLYHENRLVHNCPVVKDLKTRVTQLWSHQFANYMLDISGKDQKLNLNVEGFISDNQYSRYNRNQIYIFVNNRWVKNQKLSSAIVRGYSNVLQSGKFPAAFMFIEIDKEQVDINIHPRKEEVQFLHPRTIEQLITQSVKNRLESKVSAHLESVTFSPATKSSDTFPLDAFKNTFSPRLNLLKNKFDLSVEDEPEIEFEFVREDGLDDFEDFSDFDQIQLEMNENSHFIPNSSSQESHSNMAENVETQILTQLQQHLHQPSYKILGQLFKTYILLERDEQFIMIDQHAAHERVLYEIFSKRFEEVATVNLMFPQRIELSEHEFKLIEPYLSLLQEHGIGIELFGETQLVVSCAPVNIKNVNLQEFVQQVISWIEEHEGVDVKLFKKQLNEHIHAQMACKAAVKAGDILEGEKIHQLVRDLEKIENRLTCPHGRPTMWVVSQNEIEKQFKRKL